MCGAVDEYRTVRYAFTRTSISRINQTQPARSGPVRVRFLSTARFLPSAPSAPTDDRRSFCSSATFGIVNFVASNPTGWMRCHPVSLHLAAQRDEPNSKRTCYDFDAVFAHHPRCVRRITCNMGANMELGTSHSSDIRAQNGKRARGGDEANLCGMSECGWTDKRTDTRRQTDRRRMETVTVCTHLKTVCSTLASRKPSGYILPQL